MELRYKGRKVKVTRRAIQQFIMAVIRLVVSALASVLVRALIEAVMS